ncbi:hypothetical protein ACFL2J_05500 [Candidatus Omnitrophota bacterium]
MLNECSYCRSNLTNDYPFLKIRTGVKFVDNGVQEAKVIEDEERLFCNNECYRDWVFETVCMELLRFSTMDWEA